MNKNDLINSLTSVLSTKKEAKDAVEKILFEIKKTLRQNERVVISNFGTFTSYLRKSKKARNPKTGQEYHIPPRRVVKFKPGKKVLEL